MPASPTMSRRPGARLGAFALAATLTACLTTASATPGVAQAATPPAAAPASTPQPRPAQAGAHGNGTAPLVLVTGLQVTATPAGASPALLPSAGGATAAAGLVMMRRGGSVAAVPYAVLPFLGHGLDRSLFDLGALRRAEHGGRIPVVLRYQRGPHDVPGVTITRRSHGSADGYLTAASARTFRAALARQYQADRGHGSYGDDGLFAGGLSIGLPGAAEPAPAKTPAKKFTLTIHGTDLGGRPDTGSPVMLWSATSRSFNDSSSVTTFTNGVDTVPVPAGTYWLIAQFGGTTSVRLVVPRQFTVTGDTSVSVSEAGATSPLRFLTPHPATLSYAMYDLDLASSAGGDDIGWVTGPRAPLWVSPLPRTAIIGSLYSDTEASLSSPAGTASPYTYALNFAAPPGVIPPQRFTVTTAQLTAIHERFYSDHPVNGGWFNTGGPLANLRETGVLWFGSGTVPLPTPGQRTLYLSAEPGSVWQTQTLGVDGNGGQTDEFFRTHPGETSTEDWNAYPLHPGVDIGGPGETRFIQQPSAVRAGSVLELDVTPFSDNTPGHLGTGLSRGYQPPSQPADLATIKGSYEVEQDGVELAGHSFTGTPVPFPGVSVPFATSVTLAPHPATVRFALDVSRTGQGFRLSTRAQDVWTWPTQPDPAARVPRAWECGSHEPPHHPVVWDRHCAVQDMLTLRYHVAGMSGSGTTRPGAQVLRLSVGHLPLSPQHRVTGATAWVSFDNGATWHPTRLRPCGAPGQYAARYTALPSAGVTLRVSAHDTAGATVTETITRAYQTAP